MRHLLWQYGTLTERNFIADKRTPTIQSGGWENVQRKRAAVLIFSGSSRLRPACAGRRSASKVMRVCTRSRTPKAIVFIDARGVFASSRDTTAGQFSKESPTFWSEGDKRRDGIVDPTATLCGLPATNALRLHLSRGLRDFNPSGQEEKRLHGPTGRGVIEPQFYNAGISRRTRLVVSSNASGSTVFIEDRKDGHEPQFVHQPRYSLTAC